MRRQGDVGQRRARVRALSKTDEEFIVNVIAFDEAPCAALLALRDGESLTLSVGLTPRGWTDKQGMTRPSLDMVASHVLTAYHASHRAPG